MSDSVAVLPQDAELTVDERADLGRYEAVIQRGIDTFFDVGRALIAIRDKGLFRGAHATFGEYCRERWGIGRNYAYKVMSAAEVVENLESVCTIVPSNEAQARPLTKLEPEQQRRAWSDAVEYAGGDQPTAKQVEKAAVKFAEPKPAATKPEREPEMPRGLARAGYVLARCRNGDTDKWGWQWQVDIAGSGEGLGKGGDRHIGRWVATSIDAIEGAMQDFEARRRAARQAQARAIYVEPTEPETISAEESLIRDLCEAGRVTEPFISALRAATVEQLEAALRRIPKTDQYRWLKIGDRRELLKSAQWANGLEAALAASQVAAIPVPADLAAAGIVIEPTKIDGQRGFRWHVAAGEYAGQTGAVCDSAHDAIRHARHCFKILEDYPHDLVQRGIDEITAIAEVEAEREEEEAARIAQDGPVLRDDGRLEDARMLRDLLIAARDTARAHYGDLTGRNTDLLPYERAVAVMLEPLASLIAILEAAKR